ncbi:MAG TPA: GAF domain-containing protein [Candidatus Tectomicrobia bacterium]|nr:GAF domain-containing protein [Candidatus Tectomicrobia bacterium]
MGNRPRLAVKYATALVALVTVVLLVSGGIEIYSGYQESRAALVALQREKAHGAAARIELFVKEIERQLMWTTQPQVVAGPAALEQRRIDSLRLLRQVPAITELSHLDATGREQLRISRLAVNVVGSGIDFSADPRFREPRTGRTWFGPVYFRKESEPYMTIAMPQSGGGVTVAEVNLKFIWDVVSQIKIGDKGLAYAVDNAGNLVAHPDISLVLQKTNLSGLRQVRAALATAAGASADDVTIAADPRGREVLTAHSIIGPLGWAVFVEQPAQEALAPVRASVQRTAMLIALGIGASVVLSVVLARRLVRPIQALQAGAATIGAGNLGHRIEVRTGDELQALADQFNRMAEQLEDSYATLERRVEERTRELSEALDQQTATSEILRVIGQSTTDAQPVFDAIAESSLRLLRGHSAIVMRCEGEQLEVASVRGGAPGSEAAVREALRAIPPRRGTYVWDAILDREVKQIADVEQEAWDPLVRTAARARGWRANLGVPMLQGGEPIGLITVSRAEPGRFSDQEVELLKTFADQAVIAIENVRLFQELQARTAELTRLVEELRALSEVGRAISSTLDLDAVLAAIVTRANQLAGTDAGVIYEYDAARGDFHLRATHNLPDALVRVLQTTPLRAGEGAVGQAVTRREPVQFEDIAAAGVYGSRLREALLAAGHRALLAVPLISEDEVVGALVVNRREPGAFPPRILELLSTFATQSALAIRNARLFREIEDKGRELEVANRHKSEFLANMSHELRTPLNAIIGFSEVLLERMFGELNDKQEEYLGDILSSGRHLLSLINDILDLSKIEAGRMELEVAAFDLPQAIDNALILVRERAARRGIALERVVDEKLGEVRADERKIKQVLLNLLSNAVKFTPEGGRIEVRAAVNDGVAEIAVADTGIGIAPEDQEAIFEEFRQVGTDYAKKHEGTGLGLALARRFVELHGGRLTVESEPGRGSTFTFTIPVTPWPAS